MAAFVLAGVQVLLADTEITPQVTAINPTGTADMKEMTNMASGGFRQFLPGLAQFSTAVDCLADFAAATVGAKLTTAAALRGQQVALSMNPTYGTTGTVAVGDPTLFVEGLLSKISIPKGNVGDLAMASFEVTGDQPQILGQVLMPLASRGALTGTQVSGVAAVTATQRVYGMLHVTGAVGTNLAVTIQSAATGDSGFASPTTRLTFSTTSAIGWQYISVAGPFTDTRWRAVATVGTSTFTYSVAFAVA